MKLALILACLIAPALSGCSGLFNSSFQKLTILPSDPSAKHVKISAHWVGGDTQAELPGEITTISGKTGWTITVIDPCYETVTQSVKRSISPTFWLNFLNGFGFVVDLVRGRQWKYEPVTTIPTIKKTSCQN